MLCGHCGGTLSDGTPRRKRPPNRRDDVEVWCERCCIWWPSAGDEGAVEVDNTTKANGREREAVETRDLFTEEWRQI